MTPPPSLPPSRFPNTCGRIKKEEEIGNIYYYHITYCSPRGKSKWAGLFFLPPPIPFIFFSQLQSMWRKSGNDTRRFLFHDDILLLLLFCLLAATTNRRKGKKERVADIWEKRKRWKKMVDLSNWQMIPTASLSELAAPSIY